MKNRKKKAFTLAEVLISLTIIGVIAAITVPALVQRTNKQEYVTALQKTYSTLSQAVNMMIAENGSPKCDDEGWACSKEDVYNMFKKYLNIARECEIGKECAYNTYKYKNGTNYGEFWSRYYKPFILSNGSYLFVSTYISNSNADKKCEHNDPDIGSENICTWMFVDVNGSRKPNQLSKDTFMFVLKENGLFPAGCDDEGQCSGPVGYACTCKVLREGKMDY